MKSVQARVALINTNIAAAVEANRGDLSEFVGWMGADRFGALLAGRAVWEAAEIILLARALDISPSCLVDRDSGS